MFSRHTQTKCAYTGEKKKLPHIISLPWFVPFTFINNITAQKKTYHYITIPIV